MGRLCLDQLELLSCWSKCIDEVPSTASRSSKTPVLNRTDTHRDHSVSSFATISKPGSRAGPGWIKRHPPDHGGHHGRAKETSHRTGGSSEAHPGTQRGGGRRRYQE